MHNKREIIKTAKILNQNINWWLERFNICLLKAMQPDLDEKQCVEINAEFNELMGRGNVERKMVELFLES